MLFKRKKVRTETLSEYLAEVRSQVGLSTEEVAQKSGIYTKFIEYLETNQFQQLPPDVYVMGFLRQLSVLYAIPAKPLIEQFRKERGIAQQVAAKSDTHNRARRFSLKNFVLTPKSISIGAAVLFIGATLAYIGIELVSVSGAPALRILEPTEGQLVKESFVKISGETNAGATLTVNEQNNILVDEHGRFTTTVPVVSGQPDLVFRAENKFAKTTVKHVAIVVNLSDGLTDDSNQPASDLTLQLDFLDAVTLGLSVDGVFLPIEQMASGSSKVITAKNEVLVSTSDAGKTVVTINGQKLGRLGKTGQQMTNVPFSLQSASAMVHSTSVSRSSTSPQN